MTNRLLSICLLLLCTATQINAQSTPRGHAQDISSIPSIGTTTERSQGTSGTGANIDVIYHKILWRINPDSSTKYIRGNVQTNFKTTQANVSAISFDMNNVLIVDSIYFRFVKMPPANYSKTSNILTINLGVTLPNNFTDSLTIYYRGAPPGVVGLAQGYQVNTNRASGNVINTLSESYEDRDWWPCKHDMQDKIDSMDITVSVPWCRTGYVGTIQPKDTFWVASNGKMVDSSMVNDSTRQFVFQLRHPIPSYLVAVTVARFDRVYRTVNIHGTAVPVVYNICKGASYKASAITAMDNVNLALIEFSNRFGDYPFKDVKHGFSDGLDGAGGMEHETMSSIASNAMADVGTLVHEMTHQWFGDNVTFAHWNDLWLAEGFARYSEALYQELIPSLGTPAGAASTRSNIKSAAIGYSNNSAYIPNSSSATSNLIWGSTYGNTVYERGAMIVSMLRAMCGDVIFFNTLKQYQTDLAGKSATTDTLRNYFNRALGRDISVFFDDYVGGSDTISNRLNSIGSPTNTVSWNSIGTTAAPRLVVSVTSQAKTTGSNVTYFRGPIQLHVQGSPGDTTITIFDWGGGNLSYAGNGISLPIGGNRLTFDLSFTPTTVLYDDSSRTMSYGTGGGKTGTSKLTTLNNYIWKGTTNSIWGTATNWLANLVPPTSGADITIATTGSNQPILPANDSIGVLTINGANTLSLNGFTLTLLNAVRSTGTITGSAASKIVVADQAGTLNFTQTNLSTHSLNTITLNPKASVTIGTGLLDIFGGLTLPPSTSMTVKSSNMLIH